MEGSNQPAGTPGSRLRQLLSRDRVLVAPGAYDALTATLIERAGFEAVYLTGSGVSYSSLAKADVGFIGLGEMVEHARWLTGAVSIPVVADGDTGYGNAVNVYHTVREYERAGVAAIQIEDQTFPKKCGHYLGRQLVSIEEMVGKIRAACDARVDSSFVVIARTDARTTHGLEEAVRRARAFEDAGADMVFVESLESAGEMRAVTSSLSVPAMANMVEGGRSPLLSAEELQALGYRFVIFPNAVARTVTFAAAEMLSVLMAEGTTRNYLHRMLSFTQISELVGAPEARALEEKYRAPGYSGTSQQADRR